MAAAAHPRATATIRHAGAEEIAPHNMPPLHDLVKRSNDVTQRHVLYAEPSIFGCRSGDPTDSIFKLGCELTRELVVPERAT